MVSDISDRVLGEGTFMLTSFLHNTAIIIACIFLLIQIRGVTLKIGKLTFKWVTVLTGGFISVFMMVDAVSINGIQYDLRMVPIYVISYVYGWRWGVISILPALSYQVFLGESQHMLGMVFSMFIVVMSGAIFHDRKALNTPLTLINTKRILLGFTVYSLSSFFLHSILFSAPFIIWIKPVCTLIAFSYFSLIGIVSIFNNVNNSKLAQEELEESEQRYRYLIEASPEAIIIFHMDSIFFANSATKKLLDVETVEELFSRSVYEFIDHTYQEQAFSHITSVIMNNFIGTLEYKLTTNTGRLKYAEITGRSISYMGKPAVLSILKDITDRKQAEEQINHMAYHDALTDLPNRYQLTDYLKKLLELKSQSTVGIMFIDLDRFKLINDSMGHDFGDDILKQVSLRLRECVRGQGKIFRHGGDEFIILMEGTTEHKMALFAQRLLSCFDEVFEISNRDIFISPSIGISMYPTDGEDVDTLIKSADSAMYLAKDRGRNNYQFFTSRLNDIISKKLEIEMGLRKALENEELLLYYQPQIELVTGKVVGMEALIRWEHPEKGTISPIEFIPVAEETGLIDSIGEWVVRTACKQNQAWQDAGLPVISVAVNISPRQMQHREFVKMITKALEESGLNPKYLELEVTESIMQNLEETTPQLQALKAIGVKIAIDDFGTGYSALHILRHLPIDKLKIDRSFIQDIFDSYNSAALVKTIIEMGHNLHFKVIAEGIEDRRQLNFLKENKCDMGQGYYYCKPIHAGKVTESLFKEILFEEAMSL